MPDISDDRLKRNAFAFFLVAPGAGVYWLANQGFFAIFVENC